MIERHMNTECSCGITFKTKYYDFEVPEIVKCPRCKSTMHNDVEGIRKALGYPPTQKS